MIHGCLLKVTLGDRIGGPDEEWALIGPLLPLKHGRGCLPAGRQLTLFRRYDVDGAVRGEGLGRLRGGYTTKLYARCDGHGRPLGLVLTPRQAHDVDGFGPLFRMLNERIDALLANKGYDSDAIRAEFAAAGVEAVIPTKSNRRVPIPHDREIYRWRDLVEYLFSKLKNWLPPDTTKLRNPTSASSRCFKLWLPFVHDA